MRLRTDVADLGYYGTAQRSAFVADGDGVTTYRRVADEPGEEPDYGEVVEGADAASGA